MKSIMAKKQTPFFASHSDLVSLLLDAATVQHFKIVLAGLFDSAHLCVLERVDNIMPCQIYLILEQSTTVELRKIEQRAGGCKYAVDQVSNSNSVFLYTGGLCLDQHLVAGQVGLISEDKDACVFYSLLVKLIKKNFEKIKSYYVGPEAAVMMDRGVRLSATRNGSKEYDLTR
jgi:hypothetical protein